MANLNSEITAGSVIVSVCQVRISIVLGLLEIVKNVFEAPARISVPLPDVVVELVSSDVEHVVQHRRAAHHLAARPVAAAFHVAETSATCNRFRNEV